MLCLTLTVHNTMYMCVRAFTTLLLYVYKYWKQVVSSLHNMYIQYTQRERMYMCMHSVQMYVHVHVHVSVMTYLLRHFTTCKHNVVVVPLLPNSSTCDFHCVYMCIYMYMSMYTVYNHVQYRICTILCIIIYNIYIKTCTCTFMF